MIRLRSLVARAMILGVAGCALLAHARASAEDDFRLDGHESTIESLSFAPDGKHLATGAQDKTARYWTLADKSAKTFKCDGRGTAFSVSVAPNGKWLAAGDFVLSIMLWNLPGGEDYAQFEGDRKQGYVAQRVAFSPKSDLLVAGFNSGELRAFDVAAKAPAAPFKKFDAAIHALAFSPDGSKLAVGSRGALKIFDVASRKELLDACADKTAKDIEVHALAWTPDGTLLVSGDKDGYVRVWDAATGAKKREFKLQLPGVDSLALSPDGKYILAPWQNWDVIFLDLATLKIEKQLRGFEESPRAVAFSPDGAWIAAACNNYVRVFRTSLMQPFTP